MDYALLDKKYVWHPFTQMQDWIKDDIVVIERGKGVWLYDMAGKKYIDGVSSLWVTVHGHANQALNDAIKIQLDKIAHTTFLGLSHPLAVQLAAMLIELTPSSLNRVFYSDNGSTSMEIALKIAYQYWQQKDGGKQQKRTKFVTFTNAYHGDTIGSVSLGAIDLFHKIYKPLLFDTFNAPYPYPYRFNGDAEACKDHCLQALEQLFKNHGDEIAAVVIEPEVQGASGMIMTPPGYMKGVERITRKYGALLVVDEVATGFGRTGYMFASNAEQIKPDIMAVAKSITGGYLPLAATITSEAVFEAFLGSYDEQKTFFHGHTYTANPLACAAAIANLELFEHNNLLHNIIDRAKQLDELLKPMQKLDHVGDIRKKGLMIGIELVEDKSTAKPYSWQDKIGIRVIEEARNHNLIIRPLGNVIVLMPPLCISADELAFLVDGTYKAVKTVTERA
ncbi:MAG: adenosylmethionine--8-amino-7-oxononanoate transaminase [Candidatus Auribacterota bacterium]|jgi:adenosylmethionine-8-amino-7-oxononanoate transaminase|nr:adenosylmethionine--8-amino-7-oxononanoate transaminase [Candidatus Auribacterota bacterium]